MNRRGFLKAFGIVGSTLFIPNVPKFIADKVLSRNVILYGKPKVFGIDTETTRKLFEEYIIPGIIKEVESRTPLWDRFNNTS